MYREFKLSNIRDASVMGYHWEAAEPCCVVIIIHGIGEYAGRFDRMAELLREAHIASMAMDLRGHGCSSGKRGHAAPREVILSDLDHLIEQVERQYPALPVIVYGHSMGGNLILDHRRRGILSLVPKAYVASSPWLILPRKVSKAFYYYVKCMAKMKPDFAMRSEVNPLLLGNVDMIAQEKHSGLMHGQITAQAAIEGYEIGLALAEGKPLGKRSGRCGHNDPPRKKGSPGPIHGPAAPFLLMHGDEDRLCSVEGSRKLAQLEKEWCTYIEWPGYFHELHNGNETEDGETVIRTMIDWIKGLLL